jgi:hypothetical protein
MSVDILLRPCSLSDRTKSVQHPVTGRTEQVPDDQLVPEEVAGVNELLARVKAPPRDETGCYPIRFSAKDGLELFMDGLDGSEPCEGGLVCVPAYSPRVFDFLHELSRVGNLMLLPIDGEELEIVTSDRQRQQVRVRHPDVLIVPSAASLGVLLEQGIDVWEANRAATPRRRPPPRS